MLDARDKLVRLTTKRTVDIKRVVSTKGVCPDMCPEKERIMREVKHQVASFESVDGSRTAINHLIAVKEYSRSSADQEYPLPYELRPEPVLKMTMTYLLQRIADLCDVSEIKIEDWYHFLWDRTRSIRKDITQQELCSPGAVLLVEQCARFHIHCAARLIADEPPVFDQKINNENLTKCLQSLKYMYHDLELKLIRCPNEAEFRAYVVLLNLQNDNFLWEVKQLRPEILNSPEMRFAINVYLAKITNNYVRFFALVRSTTYMNACILLRYFTEVRENALNIMLKAYAPRTPVILSISSLTYTLAFEDAEQCTLFFEYYGLMCDRHSDEVRLDRGTFFPPKLSFIMDRAINVVEHKRHSSVGDALYGDKLDENDVLGKYVPHDSFDENGYLLPRAWTAGDQDYFRPQARVDARNKRPQVPVVSKRDDSVFKVPTSLPPSRQSISPKAQRLSSKTVTPELVVPSAPTSDIFTGNSSNSNKQSESVFKTLTSESAKSVFSRLSSQNRAPATTNLFPVPAPMLNDTPDGKSVFSTDNFTRAKPSPFTSTTPKVDNIFAAPKTTESIFGQPSPLNQSSSKIFGQPTPPNQPNTSIFGPSTNLTSGAGVFGSNFTNAQQQTPSFAESTFKMTPTASTSSVFGSFTKSNTSFGAIEPLPAPPQMHKVDVEAELLKRERELLLQQQKLKAEADKRMEEDRRRKEEMEQMRKRRMEGFEMASSKCLAEIIGDVVASVTMDLAEQEIERHRATEDAIQRIYAELLHEVIEDELQRIAMLMKTAWDKNILDKYFSAWRSVTRKAIEQRRKIETTPIWLPSKSMPELVTELYHPVQTETLKLMRRYRSGVAEKLVVPPIREDIIDLWSIVMPSLQKCFGSTRSEHQQQQQPQQRHKFQLINSNIYWKCVVSVPDADEDSHGHRTINAWLNNVFVRQLSKYPRDDRYFFAEQSAIDGQRVSICMRKLSGAKLINESHQNASDIDFRGTNAILFFMTTRNPHVARARLDALLRKTSLHDATGLVIYNMGTADQSTVVTEMRLSDLIDFAYIDRCVFSSPAQGHLANRTENCLRYIAANSFYKNQLEMQQTSSLLRQSLADEFWQRIHSSIEHNPTLHEASTDFAFLADYHNEAVDRMISMCTSPTAASHAEFPDELRHFVPTQRLDIPMGLEYFPVDWKAQSVSHQQLVRSYLHSVRIHDAIDVKRIRDRQSLEREVLRFTQSHLAQSGERTAYKMLKQILSYLGAAPLDLIAFQEKLMRYNWIDCLPIFTMDLLVAQYERMTLPEYIIYDRDEYEEYTRTAWWLTLQPERLKELTRKVIRDTDLECDRLEQQRKRQRIDVQTMVDKEQQDLDAILAKGFASMDRADRLMQTMRDDEVTMRGISRNLEYSLHRHECTLLNDDIHHMIDD